MKNKFDEIRDILQKYGEDTKRKYVYHYTTGTGLKSIVENNQLWLSERNYMNDKLEIAYTKGIIKDVLKANLKFSENIIDRFFFEKEMQYVFSTSLTKDSINMWSYYSGVDAYCIEFDRRLLRDYFLDTLNGNGRLLYGPVIYNKTKQKKIMSDVCVEVIDEIKKVFDAFDQKIDPDVDDFINAQYVYQFFYSLCKQQGHSCENEFRYLVGKVKKNEFIIKTGLFVPTIKIGSIESKKVPINKIIIGPNNHEDIALESIRMFLDQNGYKKVRIAPSSLGIR